MGTRSGLAIALVCLIPVSALAQDDRGVAVGGSVSAANMESRTELGFTGTVGYRFGRVVGFDIETTYIPTVRSAFPDRAVIQSTGGVVSWTSATSVLPGSSTSVLPGSSVLIYPAPYYSNPGGRIVVFANNVRVDIPTTTSRVTPYFVAGGGIANVRRTADFTYSIFTPSPLASPIGIPQLRPISQRIRSSSTDLALTLGGGVGVRVVSHLSVDADLRVFRLLGDEDRNLGRFGVGVRYRF